MTGTTGSTAEGARPPEHRWRLPAVIVVAALALVAAAIFALARGGDGHRTEAGRDTSTTSTSVAGGPPADGGTTEPGATTTATGPEATTTTVPEEPPGPDAITLAFAGDLLPHMPLNDQAGRYGQDTGRAFDYDPMFAPLRPVLEPVDAAICHLEVPIAPPGEALSGYPAFGAPAELVDGAKAAGYDGCSNASNHSLDRGRDGIAATLDAFDRTGLHHAGIARTEEEAATTTFYDVHGVKVAHLSYAYDFNGYRIPTDAPWAVNQIDVAAIHTAATRARDEGAQLVVLSLHWGTEYQHDPSAYQRDIADQLLPFADLDLIIGHHAHVVQPIERVEGTLVVWGLGNQLANQQQAPKADGLTVVVTARPDPAAAGGWSVAGIEAVPTLVVWGLGNQLSNQQEAPKADGLTVVVTARPDPAAAGGWSVAGIEAVPTLVEGGTFRILPVVATLADPATPGPLRDLLVASYDRTAEVLGRTPTDGVTLAPRP